MGVQLTRFERAQNLLKHAIKISKNVIVPKPNDPETVPFYRCSAHHVGTGLFNVLTAIQFNHQLFL